MEDGKPLEEGKTMGAVAPLEVMKVEKLRRRPGRPPKAVDVARKVNTAALEKMELLNRFIAERNVADDAPLDEKRARYWSLLDDPAFHNLTTLEQERVLGVTRVVMYKWRKEIDWDRQVEKYRRVIGQEAPKVFNKILEQALAGSEASQELYLKYFLNWSPRNINQIETGRDSEFDTKTNKEVVRMALEKLPESERKDLIKMAAEQAGPQ
jgi:hypothetical protein